ncbi:AsnC family transcriptional regulator [Tardibacter chloracetimidivorans]|uniref:AsnC family transcriptional regulator n=1 Tax=Tardibacter chloracetimidivorans TaxID=1921510 RepID=A0A1L3ZW33_9SPHN|nr:Lrp/AsnC family transcriptional regulator [Tardibacter chloracetimidivorans]API59810.1 AsnC family transcriptional regulator [Tardibacter chloracetimidivorans]
MAENLDRYELRILALLQEDASRPTTEIAEIVGLSQAPCWRRIQRLKEAGYIKKTVCLLDRRKLGLNAEIFAQVKLSANGRADVSGFSDAIGQFPEVIGCFVLLGSVDFMLRIVAEDIEAYERFFFEKLSQVPGVQEINSMVALSEIKNTTAFPLVI